MSSTVSDEILPSARQRCSFFLLFLTRIKSPPPRADLSFLEVGKPALKTPALLIPFLSHDSAPITTSGIFKFC